MTNWAQIFRCVILCMIDMDRPSEDQVDQVYPAIEVTDNQH